MKRWGTAGEAREGQGRRGAVAYAAIGGVGARWEGPSSKGRTTYRKLAHPHELPCHSQQLVLLDMKGASSTRTAMPRRSRYLNHR